MRKIYHLISIITVCLFAFSCKKKVDIKIDSLSKSGEEFYFGEKVPVWAATSGDKNNISYEWKATGGSFDGWRTQNLFENLWIAPNVAGEYTITATAKNGGSSSSKSTLMKVTRYYFDEFQSAYTLNGNGWSTSNTTNVLNNDSDPALSTLEITASSSSTPNIRRSLNLAELKIPFSIQTKVGWKNYFRANSTISFRLFFNQPANNPNYPFIRELRCEVWPTVNPSTTDNYQIRYETFVPATNTSKFSADGNVNPNPLPLISPVKGRVATLAMTNGKLKSFSFSIGADNVFYAYIDGTLWFTSNGIKDWLTYAKANYPGFADPVVKQYQIDFPAKETTAAGTTLFLKSLYINNDGQILK